MRHLATTKIGTRSGYDHLACWFFNGIRSWVLVVVLSGTLVLSLDNRIYPKTNDPKKQTKQGDASNKMMHVHVNAIHKLNLTSHVAHAKNKAFSNLDRTFS